MDDYLGFSVGLFISGAEHSLSPSSFSFVLSDNIHSIFPTLQVTFLDPTGNFLELGAFTQGIDINAKLGFSETDEMFDANFKSVSRDLVGGMGASAGLSGVVKANYIHSSYFENRESKNKALKDITASDAVKQLFDNEKNFSVEDTKGKIEVYAFDEPYKFTKDVLLNLSTNGKISPYMFFRDLNDELHFQSVDFLEKQSAVETLKFGEVADADNSDAYNTIISFLPFNENLIKALPDFNVKGRFLKSDLSVNTIEATVADNAKDIIPVSTKTKINHNEYFSRQFNPSVEYDSLNTALCSNSIKNGIFVDKVLCTLPLHAGITAGKVVDVEVSLFDEDKKIVPSETFSSSWLVEQSKHIWNGADKNAVTELVLTRTSMKPASDSALQDNAFGV